MKRVKRFLRTILPHPCIVISGMFLVFFCIDYVNPIMNFIYHRMTEGLLLLLSLIGIVNSIILIGDAGKPAVRKRRHR